MRFSHVWGEDKDAAAKRLLDGIERAIAQGQEPNIPIMVPHLFCPNFGLCRSMGQYFREIRRFGICTINGFSGIREGDTLMAPRAVILPAAKERAAPGSGVSALPAGYRRRLQHVGGAAVP